MAPPVGGVLQQPARPAIPGAWASLGVVLRANGLVPLVLNALSDLQCGLLLNSAFLILRWGNIRQRTLVVL